MGVAIHRNLVLEFHWLPNAWEYHSLNIQDIPCNNSNRFFDSLGTDCFGSLRWYSLSSIYRIVQHSNSLDFVAWCKVCISQGHSWFHGKPWIPHQVRNDTIRMDSHWSLPLWKQWWEWHMETDSKTTRNNKFTIFYSWTFTRFMEWFFNIFEGYSISRIKEYIKHQEKLEIKQFDYR